MDLSALIARFRTLTGDHGVPPLWVDEDVIAWLNEAEREAAERARLLHDRVTDDVVQIPLLIDTREYRLHPSVFDVEGAALERPGTTNGCRRALCRADAADLTWSIQNRPNLGGWGDYFHVYGEAAGDGSDGKYIIIDRKPQELGGLLHLSVYRYPLQDMEDGGDEPEISPRHHDGLVDWALHRAYSIRDAEGENQARSDRHAIAFERRFGIRNDANVMRKHVRHRAPIVRPLRW